MKTDLHWPVEGCFDALSRFTRMGDYQPLVASELRNIGESLVAVADALEAEGKKPEGGLAWPPRAAEGRTIVASRQSLPRWASIH